MITKLFTDLSPGQGYAVRVRAIRADGQNSDWSQILRFTSAGDQVAPGPVTSMSWAAVGTSFVAKWNPPTVNADGTPLLDLKDYRVIISRGGTNRTYYITDPSFDFSQSMNYDMFGELAYTLDIAVSARDQSGNFSTPVTANAVQDVPPVPSTPIVGNLNGLITVKWDGNTASGTRNPISVEHVEVHASTTSNFTPSESTEVGRFNGVFPTPQQTPVAGFAYGATVYVRLVAVNRTGRKSAPSVQASGTPTRITGLDIQNGQIGVAQINFTAYDIGGANAYYPATNAARDAIVGAKANDIAYVTGSGYATYRYNGTAWVSAPEIGVIQGSKILAGTVTSNAVGTNLLITTSANIGTAVIDSANIAFINAAKITTGTLQSSSTVSYGGGSPRPTWSFNMTGDGELNNVNVRGQLVIGNTADTSAVKAASLVRSYDYVANTSGWAIKGDGSVEFNNGTFRGTLIGATFTGGSVTGSTIMTAASGRRLELLTGTGSGSIRFVGADGSAGSIRGYSGATDLPGTSENIIIQSPISGTYNGWNGYIVQNNEANYIHAKFVKIVYGGGASSSTAPELMSIAYASNRGTGSTYPTMSDRIYMTGTDMIVSGFTNSYYMVDIPTMNFYPKGPINGAEAGFLRMARTEPGKGSTSASAQLKFLSPPNPTTVGLYGVSLKMNYAPASQTAIRLEVRNVIDDGYEEIWAAGFPVSSDMKFKENIRTLDANSSLEKIKSMQPKKFKRKRAPENGKSREEIGMLAQDMPKELVIDGGKDGLAIDHFAVTTTVVDAIKEMAQELDTLKEELRKLKEKK